MKNNKKINSLRINLLAVVVILVATMFGSCARSLVSVGDKNIAEVAASQKIFQDKIKVYREEIISLNKKNYYFEQLAANTQDSTTRWQYYKKISVNDSVINVIMQKVNSLEDQGDEFIVRAAGKDKNEIINLYGGDPYKLAEAYSLIKYSNNASVASALDPSGGLIGIVENTTYRKNVGVLITGPANFSREFMLGPRQESPSFKIPMPGNYTVTFLDGFNKVSITKKVGPNIIYYGSDGSKYDFKATLLR